VNGNDGMIKLFEKIPPKSLAILHSHTKEVGLSGKDFALACQYPSIAKVGQITPKGLIEEVSVVKAGRNITDTEINKLANEILDELLALRKKGVYTGTDWELIQARNKELKARMRELYGWELE
jgi:propanediol utilization protein